MQLKVMTKQTKGTMKHMIRLAFFFIIFIFTLSGCYYDKENELYPTQANCDTIGIITYSQSVAPIMTANCNTCHSAGNPSGGIITSNYEGLSIVAKNGRLYGAVSRQQGFLPMPDGADQLSTCDLTKIKKWVDAGSPNN
jgi:hypothetical protein